MTFHPLEKMHQLYDGYCKSFSVSGKKLLLIQNEGRTYLITNRCPHMDAPLDFATFDGEKLRCPVHGIEFDLPSGRAMGSLAGCINGLENHTITYEGNQLGILI